MEPDQHVTMEDEGVQLASPSYSSKDEGAQLASPSYSSKGSKSPYPSLTISPPRTDGGLVTPSTPSSGALTPPISSFASTLPNTPRTPQSGRDSRASSRASSRGSHEGRGLMDEESEENLRKGSRWSNSSSTNGRNSGKSSYESPSRLCVPTCYSRPKPPIRKRFSRSNLSVQLNRLEDEIFINEPFPLEITFDSSSLPQSDIKLRIDIYEVTSNKKVKEAVLDFGDAIPVIRKGAFETTVTIRINKVILGFAEPDFYLKVRGEHLNTAKTNTFRVIAQYRVVLVGDSGVGKSWLVDEYLQIQHNKREQGEEKEYEGARLLGGESSDSSFKSRGGDGKIMREMKFQVEVRGRPVHILLFDTSGDKEYRSKLFVLNQETDFVLLCFSVVDYESYDHLAEWKEDILKRAPRATFAVIGLKKDLRDDKSTEEQASEKRKDDVLEEFGFMWTNTNEGVFYTECSIKDADSIETAFKKMMLHLTGEDRPALKRSPDRSCSTCLIS